MFTDDDRFEHTVDLAGTERGAVVYRFFRRPLPSCLQAVRAGLYQGLSPIANRWMTSLGRSNRYPTGLNEYLRACAGDGQSRTPVVLLRYEAGGFNAAHRDVSGRQYFPFQAAICLSRRGVDHEGGSLRLLDDSGSRGSGETEVESDQGEAIVFATTERPVRAGRRIRAQPVRHAVAQVTRGTRYAVGMPFHDYLGGE